MTVRSRVSQHPSPQRPVGWRNDGTGVFPDTKPPLRWVPKTKWTEAKNIRWLRTFDRKWSNAQPIVVGKHVLATLENLTLVCLDADLSKAVQFIRLHACDPMIVRDVVETLERSNFPVDPGYVAD